MQLFANHAHGRGAAASQAFNKLNAVVSIRANGNGIMNSFAIWRALDFKRRTQIFYQLETAGHRATECAADANVSFASRLLAKHWIESHEFENIDRLQAQLLRDPWHGVVADESEMFLPQVQQRHGCTSPVIARIARDRFIHFPFQLGGNSYARRVHQKWSINWIMCCL